MLVVVWPALAGKPKPTAPKRNGPVEAVVTYNWPPKMFTSRKLVWVVLTMVEAELPKVAKTTPVFDPTAQKLVPASLATPRGLPVLNAEFSPVLVSIFPDASTRPI